MANRKSTDHSPGPILYSIAALALSLIAWNITGSLSEKITGTLRILTISLSILFSLLAVYIQYRKVYGKSGRMARLHQLRIRKEETKDAFFRRKSAAALWALCCSFILLFIWALLCWGRPKPSQIYGSLPSRTKSSSMSCSLVAFGASLSFWAVADQFIP